MDLEKHRMDTQNLLQGLRFYLPASLFVALIPTAIIISITIIVKTASPWKATLLGLFAGLFMWCYLAYWSMEGFLVFPLGVDAPRTVAVPFALIGGIIAGIAVYVGTNHYLKNRNVSGLLFIVIGYLIFVFLVFSILNNRGVSN
jgi:hypothetical protein